MATKKTAPEKAAALNPAFDYLAKFMIATGFQAISTLIATRAGVSDDQRAKATARLLALQEVLKAFGVG